MLKMIDESSREIQKTRAMRSLSAIKDLNVVGLLSFLKKTRNSIVLTKQKYLFKIVSLWQRIQVSCNLTLRQEDVHLKTQKLYSDAATKKRILHKSN